MGPPNHENHRFSLGKTHFSQKCVEQQKPQKNIKNRLPNRPQNHEKSIQKAIQNQCRKKLRKKEVQDATWTPKWRPTGAQGRPKGSKRRPRGRQKLGVFRLFFGPFARPKATRARLFLIKCIKSFPSPIFPKKQELGHETPGGGKISRGIISAEADF